MYLLSIKYSSWCLLNPLSRRTSWHHDKRPLDWISKHLCSLTQQQQNIIIPLLSLYILLIRASYFGSSALTPVTVFLSQVQVEEAALEMLRLREQHYIWVVPLIISSGPSWPWLHPSPSAYFSVVFPSFLLHAALHSAPPIVPPPRSLQLKWSVTMWRSVLKACLYGRDLDSLSPLQWRVADIQSAGRISFRHLFTLDTCHAEMAAY